jgi:hypothetical protein
MSRPRPGRLPRFVIDPSTTQNGQFPIPENPGNTGKDQSFNVQFWKARNKNKPEKKVTLFLQVK